MTPAQVTQIYQELETLAVPLKQDPQLGLQYLRECLMECRRKQDRISELLVQVNRDVSDVRGNVRAFRASVDVARGAPELPALKADLAMWVAREDHLKYLLISVRLRRENLRATSADIRLMVSVIEQQLKLGEVQPPKPPLREVNEVLPFMVDGPQELSLDSEWPPPDEALPKKVRKKQPAVVDDEIDIEQIF